MALTEAMCFMNEVFCLTVSLSCRSCCCTTPSQCGGSSGEVVCVSPWLHGSVGGTAGQQCGHLDTRHYLLELHGKGLCQLTVSCCEVLISAHLSHSLSPTSLSADTTRPAQTEGSALWCE